MWAISLFSMACRTSSTTCFSRKVSSAESGNFRVLTLDFRHDEHNRAASGVRNSLPQRKQVLQIEVTGKAAEYSFTGPSFLVLF